MLGLRMGGSELIEGAHINLRVLRGRRTSFTYASTLGQLFPDTTLSYHIPWIGQLRQGTYRVIGSIRPQDAAAVDIDRTVEVSGAKTAQAQHDAAASAQQIERPPVGLAGARTGCCIASRAVHKRLEADPAPGESGQLRVQGGGRAWVRHLGTLSLHA